MLRLMDVTAEGARILGSLVEKQLTTPQQYPLTMNALVAACNQTSNRDPVVAYDEEVVTSALEQLKEQRLVRFVLPSHGRSVMRFRHVLDETLALDQRQCALLSVLLLRGPQTVGELRLRTERVVEFVGLDEIENEFRFLTSRDEPLVANIGRMPGQKEERWQCTLVEAPPSESRPVHGGAFRASEELVPSRPSDGVAEHEAMDPLEELRGDLMRLRTEFGELRRDLDSLRHSLGE
jgi:uncharacterized protein